MSESPREAGRRPAPDPATLSRQDTDAALRVVLACVADAPAEVAAILDACAEPCVAFTGDRKIVTANAAGERLFGAERHQLDGLSTDELVPARLRQPDPPPMVATPDLMSVDLPGLRRDGTELPLAWTFGAIVTPSGPIFVMIVRDRGAIDAAVDALRESEERFRLLLAGVRDHALILLDETAHVSTWSVGAELIKQWSAAEAIGKPYATFFSEADRAAHVPDDLLAAAVKNGSVEASGWRVRKDGSRFYAESFLSTLRNEGRLRGYAIVTHDLTPRIEAEENERRLAAERAARQAAEVAEKRARLSEERLARVHRMTLALAKTTTPHDVATAALHACLSELAAAGFAFYMLADDGRTLRLLDETGYPERSLEAFRAVPLDATTPLADTMRAGEPAFFDSREALLVAYPAMREAIAIGDFEATAVLPLTSRGALLGALVVRYRRVGAIDAAERSLLATIAELASQALERARLFEGEQRARAAAEEASRAKDAFLAMLGHELRNPLAPISMAVQLMKLRGDDRSAKERDIIERQVNHMTRLIDDLLDVSRIARGLVELSRRPVSVAEILSHAVEMASPLLEQREHRLAIDPPPSTLMLDADPGRLAQVVSNLLANAAKYTPPRGNVHLSSAREGDHAVIRVRDDGEGIGPELLPHVFDMFVQGQRTFDRSAGGLGLGLALVKSLVSLHGGTVSATSEGVGRGTLIEVRLPAIPDAAIATSEAAGDAARPSASSTRRRILVVDDNEDAAEMLSAALQQCGYDVAFAFDGPEALERLRDFAAEVAILDLGLPTIDGFELARRIGVEYAHRRPRLLALTGYGQPRDRAQSDAAGFEAHLTKPVDIDAVVDAVEGRMRGTKDPPRGAPRAP